MQLVRLQNPRRRKPARRRNAATANPTRRRRRNTTARAAVANPRRRRRRYNPATPAVMANPRRRRRRNPIVRKANRKRHTRRRNPESLISTLLYGGGGAVANGIVGGVPLLLPVVGGIAGSLPFAVAVSHGVMAFVLKFVARKVTGSQDKANLIFTGAIIETGLQVANELIPNYQGLIGGINNSPVIGAAIPQGALPLGDVFRGDGPGFGGFGDVFRGGGPGFNNAYV